ncbi:hypothetical protein H6F98_04375 [Microcoleus sp. FACHB-SPT15]|uniref:hypothetical protein n=1 Tax=Microcoleus sp. FACHB-SPT15 TaxID=2692830 RepID=UPI001784EA2B|nr:hypothetical protein [Microcoleus sp. FACHB-SPT15]MBD1804709.1 hypothetical protein [Microcoleus sp. FACHB-SPT15]
MISHNLMFKPITLFFSLPGILGRRSPLKSARKIQTRLADMRLAWINNPSNSASIYPDGNLKLCTF